MPYQGIIQFLVFAGSIQNFFLTFGHRMHDEREKGSWIDSLLVEQACAKRSLYTVAKMGKQEEEDISHHHQYFFFFGCCNNIALIVV